MPDRDAPPLSSSPPDPPRGACRKLRLHPHSAPFGGRPRHHRHPARGPSTRLRLPREVAPFLTELATAGITFRQATSSCSHTAPSHASIFTGLHPPQHRLLENGQPLDPALTTLPAIAGALGYETAAVSPAGFLSTLGERFETATVASSYRPAEWVVDQGLRWLHFFDVHEWHVPERLDVRAREDLPALDGLHGTPLARWLGEHRGDALEQLGGEEALLEIVDAYDGQILAVDRELRRLESGLRRLGLDERTLWVVTSDHREGLGNHGYRGHGKHLYNEQLRVPLIVHATNERWSPRAVEPVVQLVDVTPTVVQLLGGSMAGANPAPAGRSLLQLIEGDGHSWQAQWAFSIRRPVDDLRRKRGWRPGEVFALQGPHSKVIVRSEGPDELYDLRSDPYEEVNLADRRPEERDRLARLAARALYQYTADGAEISGGEIDPRHVEELRALGYL